MVFSIDFLEFIRDAFSRKATQDDDFSDRLNNYYTVMTLVVFSILISSKQYVGNPIHCWIPKEFSKFWVKYAHDYCWIKNTYAVPTRYGDGLPPTDERHEINYYQWVPIILLCQAFLFYLPSVVWRLMNWVIGISIQDIISKARSVCLTIRLAPPTKEKDDTNKDASKFSQGQIEEMEKESEPDVPEDVKNIAHHIQVTIDSVFDTKSKIKRVINSIFFCFIGSRKYGVYLITLYIFTKCLYVANVIVQFFILQSFLGTTYKFFGFQVLQDIATGNDWKSTGHFPRITMCDFEIRSLGQRRNYTIQCVLPINLFNEKIYIFIWFWILFVAIVTVWSLLAWICRMFSFRSKAFVRSMIVRKHLNQLDDALLTKFLNQKLRADGIFLLYLIYLNAGDLVTKEVVQTLWFKYKQKQVANGNVYSNDENETSGLL